MGLNTITFTHVLFCKVKNALLTPVYCVTECPFAFCSTKHYVLTIISFTFRGHTLEVRLQTLHKIMPECESLYSNKTFSEAAVFNNLAFIYRFNITINVQIFKR